MPHPFYIVVYVFAGAIVVLCVISGIVYLYERCKLPSKICFIDQLVEDEKTAGSVDSEFSYRSSCKPAMKTNLNGSASTHCEHRQEFEISRLDASPRRLIPAPERQSYQDSASLL